MGRIVALLSIVTLLGAGALGYWAGVSHSLVPARVYAAEDCVTFE